MSITTENDITSAAGAGVRTGGEPLFTDTQIGGTLQAVRSDDSGTNSALALANNAVAVGTSGVPATFTVSAPAQDVQKTEDTLNVKLVGGSALGIGMAARGPWMQSYGYKPLFVNPIGNDVIIGVGFSLQPLPIKVGIKTDSPTADLHVNGSTQTKTLVVTDSFAMTGIQQIANAPDPSRLRGLSFDPQTGVLYYE